MIEIIQLSYIWLRITLTFTKPYAVIDGAFGSCCEIYPQLKVVILDEFQERSIHKVSKRSGRYLIEPNWSDYEFGLSSEIEKVFIKYENEVFEKSFL